MRDHTKLKASELADEGTALSAKFVEAFGILAQNQDSSLFEAKIIETEKVLNGLIRALQDD